MAWRIYKVIFCLRAPMHVGHAKVGNLRRTRPYVTGRVFWGALTMRLTRDAANARDAATDSAKYRRFGSLVDESLAFTYFYPALKRENTYSVAWPWPDERAFNRRFLRSHAGTALDYPAQSSTEGALREVEFISPRTLDTGDQVFLVGYVFERPGCELKWHDALNRVQFGGERGYGWGDVSLKDVVASGSELFGGAAAFKEGSEIPTIQLPAGGRLLAHAAAVNLPAAGSVEPLVGREWCSDHQRYRHAGQLVAFDDVCFIPGSEVSRALDFRVDKFGVWRCT